MRRLAEAGLTTREACGNSVRNITACPYAGVSADELFDVTPYAEALTRYLLRHPLSSSLPRKFKIAFEGCPEDHAFTAINDIGWRAVVQPGTTARDVRGFRVTVGGGTATYSVSGYLLHEFLPVAEMLNVAEAVIRVFHRLGDYQHKHRNRMKFLIKSLGWDGWRAAYDDGVCGGDRRRRRAAALRSGAAAGGNGARLAAARRAVARRGGAPARPASPVVGPGIVPNVRPRPAGGPRAGAPLAQHERAPAEAGRASRPSR